MRFPSIKTLTSAFAIDRATAVTVRGVLRGTINPCEVSPAAKDRDRRSYHPHAPATLKLEAVNELLNGHGVEHVRAGSNAKSPAFDYVNMGDAYTATIVRLPGGRYHVQSWGDIVERGNYA